ncbi:glycoside hydrolase family 25 protein [Streptomyces sp. RS10V-4]|uniref:glycoside hydrolase family 25 protein n=1 Tax=Streptomyces rhizoryzae TaxID=2932493 RepID=UPI002006AF56|nr:glycoside hydrolase family 25 protein [Streptomyces rhizoryzae]MCK7624281.1 glycoside hydrolase family 25 protein [Streptomyces rhizoryzae]
MPILGIDVSSSQPEKFPTSGSDFAFIKVTEGHTYTNPKWRAQRRTAQNAGLVTGFYHFARPGPVSRQVDFFLSKIDLADGDILILDWEDARVSCAWKDAWLKQVKQRLPGHKAILYCNRDFRLHRDTSSFAGDGLWIAQYNGRPGHPAIKESFLFHQYTDKPMDTSLGAFKDRAELRKWATTLPVPA